MCVRLGLRVGSSEPYRPQPPASASARIRDRAPIDFLEQAPARRFQSNEIVSPINSWPNDNTVLGPYEIFDGLANISDI
jgi:hypothetical protein